MKLKVVHVVWLDSQAENEWTPVDDIGDTLETTHSVGIMIKENPTFVLVALSYDPETKSINSYKKIPVAAIIKMTQICERYVE